MLVGLTLVAVTGAQWIDPAVALAVAAWIALAGARILRRSARELVDEALPEDELAILAGVIEAILTSR